MNTFDTLRNAIYARNAERMDRGETALTEMWITRQQKDKLSREVEQSMMISSLPNPDYDPDRLILMGVRLRVIGT